MSGKGAMAVTTAPRVVAVLQARTTSSRLPGKVLQDVAGKPMLLRQIERIRRSRLIDDLVVATSDHSSDDNLAAIVAASGTAVFRGSLDDVLDRFASAARTRPSAHVVRLTGDCPLADPDVIDAVIAHHLVSGADITTNAVSPTLPDGLDVEVVRSRCLDEANREAIAAVEREHVTQFFYRRTDRFRVVHYACPNDRSGARWTVDEPEDLAFVRAVYAALVNDKPAFGLHDVFALLDANPELALINKSFERNEGLAASIAAERAEQS